MIMNIYLVLAILFFHWILDFVEQSDKEAKGKSKELKWLLSHTINYSLGWLSFCLIYFITTDLYNKNYLFWFHKTFDFVVITFICHTITDYFTSKLNARLWEENKVHSFFVSIGFDQFLHFAQLLLTFKYIANL